MADDIVTRLLMRRFEYGAGDLYVEAADEIERLRAELATSHMECEMADNAVQELQRLAKGLHQRWQEALASKEGT